MNSKKKKEQQPMRSNVSYNSSRKKLKQRERERDVIKVSEIVDIELKADGS